MTTVDSKGTHALISALDQVASMAPFQRGWKDISRMSLSAMAPLGPLLRDAAELYMAQFVRCMSSISKKKDVDHKLDKAIETKKMHLEWAEDDETEVQEYSSKQAKSAVKAQAAKEELITARMHLEEALRKRPGEQTGASSSSSSAAWDDILSTLQTIVQLGNENKIEYDDADLKCYGLYHFGSWSKLKPTYGSVISQIQAEDVLSDAEFESLMETVKHLGSRPIQTPFLRETIFPRYNVKATSELRRKVYLGMTEKGNPLGPYAKEKFELAHELNMKDFEKSIPFFKDKGKSNSKRPVAGFTLEDVAQIYKRMTDAARKKEIETLEASLAVRSKAKAERQRLARQAAAKENPAKRARGDYLELKSAVTSFKKARPDIKVDTKKYDHVEALLTVNHYCALQDHLMEVMGEMQTKSGDMGQSSSSSSQAQEASSASDDDSESAKSESSSAPSGSDTDSEEERK